MDKETLTGYGWVVICSIILAIMIALATPFGGYMTTVTKNTVDGLLSMEEKQVEPPVVPLNKTYTLEEIEEDELLYAIGETKPEYVVAKYNDDYTAVVIFANGEDSDGIVATYSPWNYGASPLAAHQNTLQQVVYKEGIVHTGGAEASSYLFGGNPIINRVSLPHTLKHIGYKVFYNCKDLTEIIIPEGVTDIEGWAFANTKIQNITIPNNVTKISYATFNGCTQLSKVKLPNKLTTIENNAFKECTNLATITFPSGLTTIKGEAFAKSGLTSVNLTNIKTLDQKVFMNCSQLSNVKLSAHLSEIPDGTFYGCTKLESINMTTAITKIGNEAFKGSGLTQVNIFATSLGTGAFENCSKLKTVNLYGNNGGTIAENMFRNCTVLNRVTISGAPDVIGKNAFNGCTSLTGFSSSSLKTIKEGAFANSGLINYTIPKNAIVEKGVFEGCQELRNVTISSTMMTKIPENAFKDCKKLTTIIIPGTIKIIGKNAFSGAGLKTVTLKQGVVTLESMAFANCALTSITIPNSLEDIDENAFTGLSTLVYSVTVYCQSQEAKMNILVGAGKNLPSGTTYVIDSSKF